MLSNIPPVTISDRACEEIRRIRQTKGIPPEYGLRVGVRGSGCGVSLIIGFDKAKETDLTWDVDGLAVCVDKNTRCMLSENKSILWMMPREGDLHS